MPDNSNMAGVAELEETALRCDDAWEMDESSKRKTSSGSRNDVRESGGGEPAPPPTRRAAQKAGPRDVRPPVNSEPAGSGLLRQVLLVALSGALVCVFCSAVYAFADRTTWFYKFLLERSYIQYLTLFVFAYGLALLCVRILAYSGESRALEALRQGHRRSDRSGIVWGHFHRFHSHIAHCGLAKADEYARHLREDDVARLESDHGLLNDIIQGLPMLGFFGTVLGLTTGLYHQYLNGGDAKSMTNFITALATAFDTTLMALACALVLIAVQRPLRKREDGLLAALDRFIEEYLLGLIDSSLTRGRRREKDAPDSQLAKAAEELRTVAGGVLKQALESIRAACAAATEQIGKQRESGERVVSAVEQMASRVAENFAQQLRTSGQAAADFTREQIGTVTDQVVQAVRTELSAAVESVLGRMAGENECLRREMVAAVSASLGEGVMSALSRREDKLDEIVSVLRGESAAIGQIASAIEQHDGKAVEAVAAVLRRDFAGLGDRITQAVSRPRHISLVDRPLSDGE